MKVKWIMFLLATILIISCSQKGSELPIAETPSDRLIYMSKNDDAKNVVLVSGDEEYRSEEALPQLAKILSTHHGMNCTVLFAQDPEKPGIVDPNYVNNIPGLESLDDADLMILFTRFRDLPDNQMEHFKSFLEAGKPIVALRTATHAFHVRDTTSQWYHWGNFFDDEKDPWHHGFGRLVLGERWYTHHGHHKQQSTRGLLAEDSTDHPILSGISDKDIWGATDVYGVRLPLPGDSQPLVFGQVINRVDTFEASDVLFGMKPTDSEVATVNPAAKSTYNPNDPMMPIAWTKSYQLPNGSVGQSFTSTIGSSTDMMNNGVRRLIVNATLHLAGLPVPNESNVEIVGSYKPSAYSFHTDEYWDEQNLVITELR